MALSVFDVASALVASSLFGAGCARAELGGPVAGVAADGGRMAARMASTAMGSYTRHDLTRVNGGTVTEFTNDAGEVFAVSWSGPGKPDLRTLLGRYFTALQPAGGATGRAMHALRRPPQVNDADLQIQAGGHMGWFHGVAYVPSLAPPGFAPGDLSRIP